MIVSHSMYPKALEPDRVGTYAARAYSGGGFVWDAVLEYRVWCSPRAGAADEAQGSDYFCAFATYEEALEFSRATAGAEPPLALVRQDEYIDESEPGCFVHRKDVRVTEWPVEFLNRPKRTERTIPDFLSPSAPANRLDILRGLVN